MQNLKIIGYLEILSLIIHCIVIVKKVILLYNTLGQEVIL